MSYHVIMYHIYVVDVHRKLVNCQSLHQVINHQGPEVTSERLWALGFALVILALCILFIGLYISYAHVPDAQIRTFHYRTVYRLPVQMLCQLIN